MTGTLGVAGERRRRRKRRRTTSSLKEEFLYRTYSISPGNGALSEPRTNERDREDWTDVFLSHARLWSFADRYDVVNLQRLTLHLLHRTLTVYTLHEKRVGDILTLIQFVYENTVSSVNLAH